MGTNSRASFDLSLERNPTDVNVLKAWSGAQVRGGNYVRWDWTAFKGVPYRLQTSIIEHFAALFPDQIWKHQWDSRCPTAAPIHTKGRS
jgi:hypothetical protein